MVTNRIPSRSSQRMMDWKFAQWEKNVWAHFRCTATFEHELAQLREAIGPLSRDALVRFHQANFDSTTVRALEWFPVAMVAWGSGTITKYELQTAGVAAKLLLAAGEEAAAERFWTWLRNKPEPNLHDLWEAYVVARYDRFGEAWSQQIGSLVLDIAQAVALASGGIAGLGRVCAGEQYWLDCIRQIYRLPMVASANSSK